MQQQKGKIYSTDTLMQECPNCGKIISVLDFILWREETLTYLEINPEERIRIGMCECGNIFLRQGKDLLLDKSNK